MTFLYNFEGVGGHKKEGIYKMSCRLLAERPAAPLQCPLAFTEWSK